MACDTTHQHSSRRQAVAGAARLAQHPNACICDCAVVAAVKRADTRRSRALLAAAATPSRPTE